MPPRLLFASLPDQDCPELTRCALASAVPDQRLGCGIDRLRQGVDKIEGWKPFLKTLRTLSPLGNVVLGCGPVQTTESPVLYQTWRAISPFGCEPAIHLVGLAGVEGQGR